MTEKTPHNEPVVLDAISIERRLTRLEISLRILAAAVIIPKAFLGVDPSDLTAALLRHVT